jgi:hypothetical protein
MIDGEIDRKTVKQKDRKTNRRIDRTTEFTERQTKRWMDTKTEKRWVDTKTEMTEKIEREMKRWRV